MLGIRQKFSIALGGLLGVIAIIGVMAMGQLSDLGDSVDVILRENYRSVIACQDMKEALERIDSQALISLTGNRPLNTGKYLKSFRDALEVELGNVTMPGEGDLADMIRQKFEEYEAVLAVVTDESRDLNSRTAAYFGQLYPLFSEIKDTAQEILEVNQKNMTDANDAARSKASSVRVHLMAGFIVSGFAAVFFIYLTQRWILVPIRRVMNSAEEIRNGNLELVLKTDSRDELGQLSEAFNSMAEGLRKFIRAERHGVIRGRRATEEIFKVLPVAIAVTDPEGRIDFATVTAERDFDLCTGKKVEESGHEWLRKMISDALKNDAVTVLDEDGGLIQLFVNNRECFFRPSVIPVRSDLSDADLAGVAVVLEDVTTLKEQQELKKGVVSTVAHQLKTPLTSLRMSVHLMLEEKIGFLNDKQTELMVAARDESERLAEILDDLLDMERIESGRGFLNTVPINPETLIFESMDSFSAEARDRGLEIVKEAFNSLPNVKADPVMIDHVFANLLSNAFKFTSPGGKIIMGAERAGDFVAFSVADTGKGIEPEYKARIFDRFFRVPGQSERSGAGLGLAIVRQIIEAHGGSVSAESAPGRGSVFRFTLPLVLNN